MLNSVDERRFTVNGNSLVARTRGSAKNPPILLLHGWLDNSASFEYFLEYQHLYFPNHYLVALEWAGHGHSSHKSPDAYYHFVDWAYDLLCVVEQANWQKVDIIGHSMGAMIASAFAAIFPEKVIKFVSIEAFGFVTTPANETTIQLRKGFLSRLKSTRSSLKLHTNIDSAILARKAVSDLDVNNIELLVNRGIEVFEQGFQWRSDSKLKLISPIRICPEQAQDLLANLTTSTLVITGSKGLDFVKDNLTNYQHLLSELTCIEIEGGHHVHMEKPIETLKIIDSFFKN